MAIGAAWRLNARVGERLRSGPYGGGLTGQFQTAQDEAKAANEQRYQDILGRYETRRTGALSGLEGYGQQEEQDLRREFRGERTRMGQGLVSRGLTGTTIGPTMEAGSRRRETGAVGRLRDRVTRMRTDIDTGLEGETLRFMERREDEYPDMTQLERLMQKLGYAGPSQQGRVGGGVGLRIGPTPPGAYPADPGRGGAATPAANGYTPNRSGTYVSRPTGSSWESDEERRRRAAAYSGPY